MKTSKAGLAIIKKWALVGKPNECWPFSGRSFVTNGTGRLKYGQIGYNGQKWRAHRLVANLCGNTLTPDICVCHSCDNSLCMNPSHLFLGTQATNVADKMAKGRHRALRGEKNGHATISDAAVAEIRRLARSGVNQRVLAETYNVSQPLVSMIKNDKTRVMP
jgi:hypothetical protein